MKRILSTFGAIILGCLVAGCGDKFVEEPPIAITIRPGILSSCVLKVSNLSTARGVELYVYAANATNSVRSGNVVIPANDSQEFGRLQMSWSFEPGDKGFVAVEGYGQKVFFEIFPGNRYRTWTGFVGVPEIDVAKLVREQNMEMLKEQGSAILTALMREELFRKNSGKSSIWPQPQASFTDRATEKLKGWKFQITSKLGGSGQQTEKRPDVRRFKTSDEFFATLPNVEAEVGHWSIIADWSPDLDGRLPVLVSANFPCEKLQSFWNGADAANDVIQLSNTGKLGDKAFVLVYQNGTARGFDAADATLSNIYPAAFNTCTNGFNRQIRYITPNGVVDAKGVTK